MSKSAAAPAAPAPASPAAPVAPVVPVAAHTRTAPASTVAARGASQASEAKVIEWDNDSAGPKSPGERAAEEALDDDKPKAIPSKAPGNSDDKPKVEDKAKDVKEDDAPKPRTPAERRADAFDRLAAERKHRELENALKAQQGETAKERQQREALEKTAKEGPLGELLKLRGIGTDELLEMLLKKDPALEGAPAKAAAKEDPTIAELRETVKKLQARLDAQDETVAQSSVQRSVAQIQEMTKELDIPVTHAMGGYELVLRTAHELWLAGGKTGAMADFVPDAATRAEAYFRQEKPGLAKLADAARAAKADDKGADDKGGAKESAGTIGRRAAARPDTKTRSPWEGKNALTDRDEVDRALKLEFGFKDRDPDEE